MTERQSRKRTVKSLHKEMNDQSGIVLSEGEGFDPLPGHCFRSEIEWMDFYPTTDLHSWVFRAHILDELDEFQQSALSDPHRYKAGENDLLNKLDGYSDNRELNHWFIGPID